MNQQRDDDYKTAERYASEENLKNQGVDTEEICFFFNFLAC
jgi:hypothetical protein